MAIASASAEMQYFEFGEHIFLVLGEMACFYRPTDQVSLKLPAIRTAFRIAHFVAFCSNSLPNICFHPCVCSRVSIIALSLSVLCGFGALVVFVVFCCLAPFHAGDTKNCTHKLTCALPSCTNGGSTRAKNFCCHHWCFGSGSDWVRSKSS